MSFSRVGVRFAAEAGAILVAAVVAGPVLHLVWWQVGLAVFAVLGIGILIESTMAAPEPAPRLDAPVQLPPVIVETPHVRVLQERPLSALVAEPVLEPVLEPVPEPVSEPEPEPAPVAVVSAPAARVTGPPFNVWELERAHRDSGSPDDERAFLLQYLRDYADVDGTLPSEFDELVRESFAALL